MLGRRHMLFIYSEICVWRPDSRSLHLVPQTNQKPGVRSHLVALRESMRIYNWYTFLAISRAPAGPFKKYIHGEKFLRSFVIVIVVLNENLKQTLREKQKI